MTPVVGEHQPAIIVTDASVLINFLRIDRTDLLAGHPHAFHTTDHVAAEITDRYPDQQQRFAAALAAGAISETRVATPKEMQLFASMFAAGLSPPARAALRAGVNTVLNFPRCAD